MSSRPSLHSASSQLSAISRGIVPRVSGAKRHHRSARTASSLVTIHRSTVTGGSVNRSYAADRHSINYNKTIFVLVFGLGRPMLVSGMLSLPTIRDAWALSARQRHCLLVDDTRCSTLVNHACRRWALTLGLLIFTCYLHPCRLGCNFNLAPRVLFQLSMAQRARLPLKNTTNFPIKLDHIRLSSAPQSPSETRHIPHFPRGLGLD